MRDFLLEHLYVYMEKKNTLILLYEERIYK